VGEMMKTMKKLREGEDEIVSSGHRGIFPVTWRMQHLPTDDEIVEQLGIWSRKRLIYDANVDAILVDYKEDVITEEEAKKELEKWIVYPEVIDGLLAPIKARKVKLLEPVKGKLLRDELKAVFRKCYKEGFLSEEKLQEELEKANHIVDDPTLIKRREVWDAFYDDCSDWVKAERKQLEEKIISPEDFRRVWKERFYRPDKAEVYIKIAETRWIKESAKEIEKLEEKIRREEDKIMELEAKLHETEEALAIETVAKEIARLKAKIRGFKGQIAKKQKAIETLKVELFHLEAIIKKK